MAVSAIELQRIQLQNLQLNKPIIGQHLWGELSFLRVAIWSLILLAVKTQRMMLFLIDYSFYIAISMMSTRAENAQIHTSTQLQKAKSPQRIQNYEEKLEAAFELNNKLKDLMQTMRSNVLVRKIQLNQASQNSNDDQHIVKLRKKEGKVTSEVQQLTNNLNVLISENSKLKSQVDISRNSRVIYSNVYKNIEKEIRKQEYLYKVAIIDYLSYEEVEKKIKDKVHKTAKKIEKDISELEGGSRPLRKKEKRKSRLDTGLSSYRLESKETCRNSNEEGNTTRQDHMRNPSSQELATTISKRDLTQRASNDQPNVGTSISHKKDEKLERIEKPQRIQKVEKTQKLERSIRSRARLPTEKVNDYYQLEMKSNYYDNVMKHLKEITGHEDLNQILENWEGINDQIEAEYNCYLELEKQAKSLREEQAILEGQLVRRSEKEIEGRKTIEEDELALVEGDLQREKENLRHLEQKLTEIIDINSSKLSDEQISQHIQRIKRCGDTSARQLEKLLENVTKQKNQSIGASRVSNKSRI